MPLTQSQQTKINNLSIIIATFAALTASTALEATIAQLQQDYENVFKNSIQYHPTYQGQTYRSAIDTYERTAASQRGEPPGSEMEWKTKASIIHNAIMRDGLLISQAAARATLAEFGILRTALSALLADLAAIDLGELGLSSSPLAARIKRRLGDVASQQERAEQMATGARNHPDQPSSFLAIFHERSLQQL